VSVGGDQRNPGQAPGDQATEERQPARAVLTAGDVEAEDLAVPVGVHPGREQRVHRDHPAALADLEGERVGGHERVGAGVEWAGPERLDLLVELSGHHTDLRLRQPGDAEGLHQPFHPSGRHPEQVAGRDHGGEGTLGSAAPLQEPVREVGPGPQLGDRDLERARPGVPLPRPVPVAGVHPLR